MNDRLDDALNGWRDATDRVDPPRGAVQDVLSAVEREAFAGAVWSIGRGVLALTAVAAALCVFLAIHSLHELAREAAELVITRDGS